MGIHFWEYIFDVHNHTLSGEYLWIHRKNELVTVTKKVVISVAPWYFTFGAQEYVYFETSSYQEEMECCISWLLNKLTE